MNNQIYTRKYQKINYVSPSALELNKSGGLQPLKEDLQKYMSVSQGRKGPTESEF